MIHRLVEGGSPKCPHSWSHQRNSDRSGQPPVAVSRNNDPMTRQLDKATRKKTTKTEISLEHCFGAVFVLVAVVTIYYKLSVSKTQVRNQGTGKSSWFSAFIIMPEVRCQQGCNLFRPGDGSTSKFIQVKGWIQSFAVVRLRSQFLHRLLARGEPAHTLTPSLHPQSQQPWVKGPPLLPRLSDSSQNNLSTLKRSCDWVVFIYIIQDNPPIIMLVTSVKSFAAVSRLVFVSITWDRNLGNCR